MPNEKLEEYRTEWTSDGRFRLFVQRWPMFFSIACETEVALLPNGEKYAHQLAEVAFPTSNMRYECERFAEHAMRYFSQEVAALAVEAVRKIFDALREPASDAEPQGASTVPGGRAN